MFNQTFDSKMCNSNVTEGDFCNVSLSLLSPNESVECRPISEEYPNIVDLFGVRLIFALFYSLVWLAGITGNIMVIYVALFKKISFTVRTVFISSLALSDLIIGLTSLPFTAITIFSRFWLFGLPMCHITAFFQSASIYVSSFTLTAIAADRYFLIVKPHKQILTYESSIACVALLWFVGYCIALPLTIYLKMHADELYGTCGWYCEEAFPSTTSRSIYGSCSLLLQFGLPLCLSCVCYTCISRSLGRQIAHRKRQAILKVAERRLIQRRRRTNRMMTAMVLSFALAWLPLNFINFARDFEFATLLVSEDGFNIVFAICHIASMTSIVWNPIIYSWFNEPFRSAILTLLQPMAERFSFLGRCSKQFERKTKIFEKPEFSGKLLDSV